MREQLQVQIPASSDTRISTLNCSDLVNKVILKIFLGKSHFSDVLTVTLTSDPPPCLCCHTVSQGCFETLLGWFPRYVRTCDLCYDMTCHMVAIFVMDTKL